MELNQYPLRIEITNKCNLNCDYCLSLTSEEYRRRPDTDFDALVRFLEALRIYGLFLLGGEACYYYKIKELVTYCRDHHIRVRIPTNGTFLDAYKKLSAINKYIDYVVSYNKEGCPQRLGLCDRFIKEMNVTQINILINEANRDIIMRQIERFERMKKIRIIRVFSDEQIPKGAYNALFEQIVSQYNKVEINDYVLIKGVREKIDDSQETQKIICSHPLSLKGNAVSFCKNGEGSNMDITKIDFSKKNNRDKLKKVLNDFQCKIRRGDIEGCPRCRFKRYVTKYDTLLEWMVNSMNMRNIPIYKLRSPTRRFKRKFMWTPI